MWANFTWNEMNKSKRVTKLLYIILKCRGSNEWTLHVLSTERVTELSLLVKQYQCSK